MVTIRNKRTGETREISHEEAMSMGLSPKVPEQLDIEQSQSSPKGLLGRGAENFTRFMEDAARSTPDALQGFNTNVERLVQGLMQLGLKNNKAFQEVAKKREEDYQASLENSPIAAQFGGLIGSVAPTLPFGGAASNILARLLPNAPKLATAVGGQAIAGTASGAGQYVNEGESRAQNAAVGGSLGAAFPLAGKAFSKAWDPLSKAVGKAMGNKDLVAKDIVKQMLPEDLNQAFSNKMAANRLGVNITPGEASGSPILAEWESKLGTSLRGQKELLKYKRGRQAKEKDAVNKLLERVSPSKKIASEDFRKTAQDIISKKKEARKQKAEPFYKASESKEISPNTLNSLLKNKTIEKSFNKVLKDEDYAAALEGFKPTTIKTLDLVKKHMGDRIAKNLRGGNKHRAGLITDAQKSLVSAMDKKSKEYQKARSIFSQESPKVEKLENSVIGKIAKLDDTQLKTLGAKIFNPKETDISVLRNVRDEVTKENPDVWKNFVKNEMERRIATKGVEKTGAHGSNFYTNVLEDPELFKQFKESLKGDRKAQQNLIDMRKVFKDLANKRTFKGSYGKGETGMLDKRNTADKGISLATKLFGGKYDKAAIEIITGGEWDSYLRKAASNSKDPEKYNELLEAFKNASKQATIAKSTQTSGNE